MRNIRVLWACSDCGGSHRLTLPDADAFVLATELFNRNKALMVLLEDEASAMDSELDAADAQVRAEDQRRQLLTLQAHGVVLPIAFR